jgi:hypothetical protein
MTFQMSTQLQAQTYRVGTSFLNKTVGRAIIIFAAANLEQVSYHFKSEYLFTVRLRISQHILRSRFLSHNVPRQRYGILCTVCAHNAVIAVVPQSTNSTLYYLFVPFVIITYAVRRHLIWTNVFTEKRPTNNQMMTALPHQSANLRCQDVTRESKHAKRDSVIFPCLSSFLNLEFHFHV